MKCQSNSECASSLPSEQAGQSVLVLSNLKTENVIKNNNNNPNKAIYISFYLGQLLTYQLICAIILHIPIAILY